MSRRLVVCVLAALVLLLTLGSIALRPSGRTVVGNPLGRFGLSAGTPRTLTGRVLERLRAGSYTYLRVRTASGSDHWIAALSRGISTSDAVAVKVFADAATFESRRLSRTFSPLYFGFVRDAAQPPHTESP
jgi:hypothetical protein